MSDKNSGSTPAQRAAKRRRLWKKYFWRRIAILSLLAAMAVTLVTVGVMLVLPDTAPAVNEPADSTPPPAAEEPDATPAIPYPIADADTVAMGADVDAAYAVLVDVTTGRIVAQKGADTRAYPASITKMMTLLVAVENIPDLDATFEVTYAITDPGYQQGASMAGFKNEEQVRMLDLLYGCILPSGADATAALAHVVAGSEEAFAQLMNRRAEELGLKDTHFTNASGLHGGEHYTTVTDMAVILMEAMKNPTCRQVLTTVRYTSAKTEQNPDGLTWESTLFSRMYGDEPTGATIVGGKTGYTYEAKHTMASYAVGEDGHDYVIVTMGGSNNYKATYDHINILSKYVGGATDGFYPQ